MLILIHGEDTFRSREWLHELTAKFRAKFDPSGYNVTHLRELPALEELYGIVGAAPFLGTKRMVVVERLFEKYGKKEECSRLCANVPESTIFVVWEESEEALKKLPQKEIKVYAFPLLRNDALEKWVREQGASLSVEFTRGAIPELVARIGPDLWQMNSELLKFAAIGKSVTSELVRETVSGRVSENIFNFVDALGARDRPAAIRELKNERASGASVLYLLTMLARQFRMIAQISTPSQSPPYNKGERIPEGWHPFVAKKIMAQAKKFQPGESLQVLEQLFIADRAIKTGLQDPDTALDLIVARLLVSQSAT